ncbi:hypothetical protein MPH_03057 [Macrophomina phaseolina MS6]|uniref:Uncharacterized protein n=1 Tax=Macrophomina phaseolina (strain MS6) TaxID=1126212 RepID=K2RB03_MACPH|nr:hypothetical protein MPH_03057 [Macrophomina phaseolina MS6]
MNPGHRLGTRSTFARTSLPRGHPRSWPVRCIHPSSRTRDWPVELRCTERWFSERYYGMCGVSIETVERCVEIPKTVLRSHNACHPDNTLSRPVSNSASSSAGRASEVILAIWRNKALIHWPTKLRVSVYKIQRGTKRLAEQRKKYNRPLYNWLRAPFQDYALAAIGFSMIILVVTSHQLLQSVFCHCRQRRVIRNFAPLMVVLLSFYIRKEKKTKKKIYRDITSTRQTRKSNPQYGPRRPDPPDCTPRPTRHPPPAAGRPGSCRRRREWERMALLRRR